ncbi:MAG: hypothetical protein Q8P30_00625 [Candidatus Uhrbacteria bacterium]|nr:hypothetical protein [Candidatus Uhrbacteria bacterium]
MSDAFVDTVRLLLSDDQANGTLNAMRLFGQGIVAIKFGVRTYRIFYSTDRWCLRDGVDPIASVETGMDGCAELLLGMASRHLITFQDVQGHIKSILRPLKYGVWAGVPVFVPLGR